MSYSVIDGLVSSFRRMSLCHGAASVVRLSVRLSVCLSVCLSVNFLRKSLLLAGKCLDRPQTYTRWSPDGPASRIYAQGHGRGQRSPDTGTFLISRKSLLLAGKWLDRHQTYTRWSTDGPASRVCSRSRSRSCLLYTSDAADE